MRFKIFGSQLTNAEIEAIRALVIEADCTANNIDIISSIEDPSPDVDDEVILVLGTHGTCTDPDLEENLANVPNGGRRAIWIWPKDMVAAELPAAAAKYSYSVIPWNAEKLRVVVSDDDVLVFETPTGEPLPKVPTERNLCVEEKATAK